ncbi:MAG TPA: hypothetical protein VGG08_05460 [Solirubrobacteraceae bacterium]
MPRGEHTAAGPTFSVGPMDVDSAAGLTGRLGTHNKAGALLRRHAASFPRALMRILELPKDDVGSRAVKRCLDSVKEAAISAKGRHQFLREDDEVLAASVREDPASGERFVALIYRKPSGRIARGAIDADSVLGLDEAIADQKAEDAVERGGLHLAAGFGEAPVPRSFDDAAELDDAREEAERLRRDSEERDREHANTMRELSERLAALEDAPPFEGYGDTNAKDLATQIKSEGLSLYGRVGLERIVSYEEAHQNRSTVVDAAKDVLAAAEAAAT